MAVEKDQEFVENVVKVLVDKPDAVQVTRTVDEMGVLLELTVDKEDMGVVIGKEGRTAKALRTLLRVLGAKNDSRVNLKIVDPEGEAPQKKEEKEEVPKEDAPAEVKEEEKVSKEPKEEEVTEEAKEEAPAEEEDDNERPMANLEL